LAVQVATDTTDFESLPRRAKHLFETRFYALCYWELVDKRGALAG